MNFFLKLFLSILIVISPLCVFTKDQAALLLPQSAPDPINNQSTPEKIKLGRELFFDKRLSSTKTVSCNSCHNILNTGKDLPSGTDNLAQSQGVFNAQGDRNAPTVWNSGFRTSLFWDGRASSLEEQAQGPILNPVEMGMLKPEMVEKTLQEIPDYPEKFRKAFAKQKSKSQQQSPYKITFAEVTMAIAAFERTLITSDSAFEKYLKGDKKAMSESAIRGWEKFKSHSCISCHAAPTFSNQDYFIRFPLREAKDYDQRYELTKDSGRFKATHQYKDRNAWRVPSLQNVAVTAPYFHNGSVTELNEAVRIMAKAQLGKTIPDQDVLDIVEFLKSLTGTIPGSLQK